MESPQKEQQVITMGVPVAQPTYAVAQPMPAYQAPVVAAQPPVVVTEVAPLREEWRSGGCHCKNVRYACLIPKKVDIYDCNCSICYMKRNWHFVVPRSKFVLEDTKEPITTYKFGTGIASHEFCSVCGVQSFYYPRSNPDGVAVTIFCMDDYQPEAKTMEVEYHSFDGQNWEKQIKSSSILDKA